MRGVYKDEIEIDCGGICGPCPENSDSDGDGYTPNTGDCNARNSEIYPGATEICGNTIDENCDESDLACTATTSTSVPDSTFSALPDAEIPDTTSEAGAEQYFFVH